MQAAHAWLNTPCNPMTHLTQAGASNRQPNTNRPLAVHAEAKCHPGPPWTTMDHHQSSINHPPRFNADIQRRGYLVAFVRVCHRASHDSQRPHHCDHIFNENELRKLHDTSGITHDRPIEQSESVLRRRLQGTLRGRVAQRPQRQPKTTYLYQARLDRSCFRIFGHHHHHFATQGNTPIGAHDKKYPVKGRDGSPNYPYKPFTHAQIIDEKNHLCACVFHRMFVEKKA